MLKVYIIKGNKLKRNHKYEAQFAEARSKCEINIFKHKICIPIKNKNKAINMVIKILGVFLYFIMIITKFSNDFQILFLFLTSIFNPIINNI